MKPAIWVKPISQSISKKIRVLPAYITTLHKGRPNAPCGPALVLDFQKFISFMIEYIRGSIASLNPAAAVIETSGGVGYIAAISLQTFAALEGKQEARLLVHEVIREDTYSLYGFADSRERDLFRLLIGVSGVGASTALIVLSSLGSRELAAVIASGDARRLKSVKGIGTKTAERIIVDLKDKIKPAGDTLLQQVTLNSEVFEEALAAMVMLGFPKQQAQKVMKKLFDSNPDLKVEDAIKKGLAMM